MILNDLLRGLLVLRGHIVGTQGDRLGSYLFSQANGMIVRCLELLSWSQRSSSGDFSILMQNCMVDFEKESFGERIIIV